MVLRRGFAVKIETLSAQFALNQVSPTQQTGAKEAQRTAHERAALASPTSQNHAAVSVFISAVGRAAAAVSGAAGLAATARAQGSSQVSDAGNRRNEVGGAPSLQAQMVQRVVEQVTAKRLSAFNAASLGPMSRIGGSEGAQSSAAQSSSQDAQFLDQVREQLQYMASGSARATDGAAIGFTVLLELERTEVEQRNLQIFINHVGMATAAPKVDYKGPSSDLEDQAFRFDVGVADGRDAGKLQKVGNGVLVFDKNAAKTEIALALGPSASIK